jgi:hypothetical protein
MSEGYGADRLVQSNKPSSKPSTEDLEERARALMQEIRIACQMLGRGEDAGLIHELSSLCHELRVSRDLIVQAMEAMKANASKLEGQTLNNPDEELRLKRTAEIAWTEVERLNEIIEQIDEVLAMADKGMHELEKTLGQERPQHEGERLDDMDTKLIPTDLDSFMDSRSWPDDFKVSPGKYDPGNQRSSLVPDLTPPLLGDESSSGLKATLGKVTGLSAMSMKIQTDLHKVDLYEIDAAPGPVEPGHDPSLPATHPTTKRYRYEDPIMTRAGFNGSYSSRRPLGNRPFFNRRLSGPNNDTKS